MCTLDLPHTADSAIAFGAQTSSFFQMQSRTSLAEARMPRPRGGPGLLPGGEALWESFLNLLHSISWSNPALQPGALVPLCWGSPGRDPSGHEHLGGSSHCVAFSRAWGAQEIQEYLVEDSDKEAEMGQS